MGTFGSLRIRNYRQFLAGQLVSVAGTWVQRVAQSWLVLDLSHGSATALGWASSLQFLPMLMFAMWGGLLADRYPKRAILLLTQSLMALLAAGLGLLAMTGVVRVWHVYVFAFCLGVVTAVDNPTRQSFLIELVGRERLSNAVGLNSATFNLARMIGPGIGGGLVSALGTGPSFLVNAGSYFAVVLALGLMRTDQLWLEAPVRRERSQLREGVRYLVGRRDLLVVVALVFFASGFAMNWQLTLALMARSIFHSGAAGYGALLSMLGVGAVLGALVSASRARPRIRHVLAAAVALGLLEVADGMPIPFFAFVPILVLTGFAALTFSTSANSALQLSVPYHMRGRVMSAYILANAGGTPIAALLLGWAAQQFGARSTLLIGGSIALAAGLAGVAVLRGRSRATPPPTEPVMAPPSQPGERVGERTAAPASHPSSD